MRRDNVLQSHGQEMVMVGQAMVDTVAAALAQRQGQTVVEVAELARVGRSTAGKALVEMERSGRARRLVGDAQRQPGQRPAARWYLANDPGAATTADCGQATSVAATVSDLEVAAGPQEPDGETDDPALLPQGAVGSAHQVEDGKRNEGAARLGKGALRALVLTQLRADPAKEHSPSLAKLLGRSSGAGANALVRLTLDGLAVETSQRPRRYRTCAENRAA
jgi:hypothetical protein